MELEFDIINVGILFLLTIIFLKTALTFTKYISTRRPPSPWALPIIGHLHLLSPNIHRSFQTLSSRYGPLIHLRLGSIPCVVVSSPDLAKEFLKNNDVTFSSRKNSLAVSILTYNSSFAFAPYGPYWKFIKKLCISELFSTRVLNQLYPIRKTELHRFLCQILEKRETSHVVNVTQELFKLTNNTFSRMMLSMRCSDSDSNAEEVIKTLREVSQIFGEFNVSDLIWFFKNVDVQGFRPRIEDIHRRYDRLLEKIVSDREKEREMTNGDDRRRQKDLLDIMLDVLEDPNSAVELKRNDIKALVLDFFTAATDTTAISLEWAIAELFNNPIVLKKAQEEIENIVGNKRLVEECDTQNLPYIQAIVKETFRLHPPITMISRKSFQDCYIRDYKIPAHTLLFVNTWAIGRDSSYWDNPLEFRPERFFGFETNQDQIDIRGQHFQLLPFGTGRRGCPGASLAIQQFPTTLAAMIQCFDWNVVGPDGEKLNSDNYKIDMAERPGLTVSRAYDLLCDPSPRFNLHDILDPS